MFLIKELNQSEPYKLFERKFNEALDSDQKNINAIAISSLSKEKMEVDSRFVNLKYIVNDEWFFFTNYNSPKAKEFEEHNQISALLYWNKIDTQIRIKAKIKKADTSFSDNHFSSRSKGKNALAICSDQSKNLISYEDLRNDFKNTLSNSDVYKRPEYWGGFSFEPYSFEFWEGEENRLNRRTLYKKVDREWNRSFLQP